MPSSNGHGPKRAILYARVSTDEQARSGYSLAQQLEALREYAAREGFQVLEEVSDPGQSGASLERPGMDRLRDLVAAGGVTLVLAQDRDRFAREPAYHYLLKREFEEHGTKIRAMNDRGDDTPEGDLTDGILDQLAKYERAKIAERTRRGKLRRAREGKVVPTHTADYGFQFNTNRDNYVVNEEQMAVVRRIFRMIGAEGMTMHAAKKTFEREGVPAPGGGKRWDRTFFRSCIFDDVYRPHTYEEVKSLVSPDVALRLDPDKRYGIWWFNRRRRKRTRVSDNGPNGKSYRWQSTTTTRPREEWIAVPVPDSGIPREWVDTARDAIKDNPRPSSTGRRFWELSGGIAYCEACGRRLTTTAVRGNGGRSAKLHFYYRCHTRANEGRSACPQGKNFQADTFEGRVWEEVCSVLSDPEHLRADLEAMIEQERRGLRGDPEREMEVWLDKLSEVDSKRSRFQDMAAEGLITFEELGAKLNELDETRTTARQELESLGRRQQYLAELERDKNAVLEYYERMAPDALDSLTPEQRNHFYKVLRLRVVVMPGGGIEICGPFPDAAVVSKVGVSS
jgi:site-specific DNA recombinase